jgi:molybdopterin/thiamine biosynthesis adenylyltransferase
MSVQARFSSIVHPSLNKQWLHIFGCGAIGSNVAILLDKMGVTKFSLYDFDNVEQPNIGVSPFIPRDIGKPKVEMLKEKLDASAHVDCINEEVKEDTTLEFNKNSIAILAFDSMKARLLVAEKICEAKIKLLIDGRMGAELFQMYVLKNPTIKEYKKVWYSDEEGSEEPCTAKATPWCGTLTGSFISNAVSKIISGHPCPKELFFHFPSMTMDWKS